MSDTSLHPNAVETLKQTVRGEVYTDLATCGLYATDASHYQQMPMAVIAPLDEQDVLASLRVAHDFRIPLTPRGGGTSLSGQTFGPGIVIDISQHIDQVLEVNTDDSAQPWARVQPGVVRDRLNEQLKPQGLHFAPDPATGNRATVAGMIANNTSGTRSILYGKTSDHVLELKVALADGTVLHFKPENDDQWQQHSQGESRSATLHRGVKQLVLQHQDEIARRFPKVMRRVAGYALDAFVNENDPTKPWNLANLITGSEGTLAFILEAKIKLTPLPKATALCVVHYADALDGLRQVEAINATGPAAVELLDRVVLTEAKRNPATQHMATFIEGDPAIVLIVEYFGDTPEDAAGKARALEEKLKQRNTSGGSGGTSGGGAAGASPSQLGAYAYVVRSDAAGQRDVWETRKLGLGLISNVYGSTKGQAFVEDAAIPLPHLPEYIGRLMRLCESLEVDFSMYAHASVGVIHFRPSLDLHLPEHQQKMAHIAERAFEWCCEFHGCFSGEHGDGILRGQFIKPFYGNTLYEAFRQLKRLFDPDNLMNPGKIVDTPSMTDPSLLRYGENYRVAEIPSAFRHEDQGGFRLAVEQCNGVGACRKVGSGTMCPSYMATRREHESTRGRANILRLAMSGQLGSNPVESLAGDEVDDVLSLCLSCKACKQECPNSVDMSRLKADAMHFRHQQHGTPLSHRLIGMMPHYAPLAAGPSRWLTEKLAGIDRRRVAPSYARHKLSDLIKHRRTQLSANGRNANTAQTSQKQVVLFDDTYMRYYEPDIGVRALDLLEALGYEVILAEAGCCQRPAISKGLLDHAAEHGQQTMANLDHFARQGLTILAVEPSCASALTDDLPDLVPNARIAQRVAGQVQLLDAFLYQHLDELKQLGLQTEHDKLLVHGHCHEKALYGTSTLESVLQATGAKVSMVEAGCCGMAGSFGYEHYDLSKQVAEDRLLPALRAHDESWQVIAPGFSCRHQVHDFANREALHWVQTLKVGD